MFFVKKEKREITIREASKKTAREAPWRTAESPYAVWSVMTMREVFFLRSIFSNMRHEVYLLLFRLVAGIFASP